MPTRGELIASSHDVAAICDFVGADSLAYLSLEGTLSALSDGPDTYCTACWTGDYPVLVSEEDRRQQELFPIRAEELD